VRFLLAFPFPPPAELVLELTFLARTSYVPISTDFSDLWSTMAFFRGDLEGRGAHDDLAKEIAAAGKKWTAEHWRWQDMQVCE
jgi:hypothetical protein